MINEVVATQIPEFGLLAQEPMHRLGLEYALARTLLFPMQSQHRGYGC